MKIEFLLPATAELTDAISYYNLQSEGLGYEFAAEVKRTLERIVQYPDAWVKLSKRTRCRGYRKQTQKGYRWVTAFQGLHVPLPSF
jgi:hypothetical protein